MDFSKLSAQQIRDMLDQVAANNAGQTLDQYRISAAFEAGLWDEGKSYEGLMPEKWPSITFNWDLSSAGQRFAMDGTSYEDFQSSYPEGLALGSISLALFDKHLAHYCRRDTPEELWSLGVAHKLAKAIAYLRRGLPITPPLVAPFNGEFFLKGGHHRYAVAKAIKLDRIHILATFEDMEELGRIASINWSHLDASDMSSPMITG